MHPLSPIREVGIFAVGFSFVNFDPEAQTVFMSKKAQPEICFEVDFSWIQ